MGSLVFGFGFDGQRRQGDCRHPLAVGYCGRFARCSCKCFRGKVAVSSQKGEDILKWFRGRYKAGILISIVPVVLIFICVKIFELLWGAAGTINSRTFSTDLGQMAWLLILLSLPFWMGLLLAWRWFREFLLKITSKIPVVSTVANFLFNKDDAERIDKDDFPEVFFRHTDNSWTIGTVTRELQLHENPDDQNSQIVPWLVIIGPPTAPVSLTAQIFLRRKTEVWYTGNYFKDTVLSVASFGLKLNLDSRKFTRQ